MSTITDEATQRASSDLSRAQQIALAVAVVPSAGLSIFGSSVIIYSVVKKKLATPFERILLGLSISDVLITSTYFCAAFFTPPAYGRTTVAFGNDATCTATGWLAQASMATYFYNAFLSFYYLKTIVYGVSDEAFAKTERYIHGVIISFCLITACVGAALDLYRPPGIGIGCWVSDYPLNCGYDPWESGEECISDTIAWGFGGVPMVSTFLTALTCMALIYRHVRRTISKSSRHSLSTESQNRRLQQVSTQCSLYILALWSTMFPMILVRNLDAADYDVDKESKIFTLLLLQSIFYPITGFFNMSVYLRPRYRQCRNEFPDQTRTWAIRRAIFGSLVLPNSVGFRISFSRSLFSIDSMNLSGHRSRACSADGTNKASRHTRTRSKDKSIDSSWHSSKLSIANSNISGHPSKENPFNTMNLSQQRTRSIDCSGNFSSHSKLSIDGMSVSDVLNASRHSTMSEDYFMDSSSHSRQGKESSPCTSFASEPHNQSDRCDKEENQGADDNSSLDGDPVKVVCFSTFSETTMNNDGEENN